jgi:hypothetical protein
VSEDAVALVVVLLVLIVALSLMALYRRWLGWFFAGITFAVAVGSYLLVGIAAARIRGGAPFVSVPFDPAVHGPRAVWLSVLAWMLPWAAVGLVLLRRLGRPRTDRAAARTWP